MCSRQLCQKLPTFQSAQLQNGFTVSERLPFATIWDIFLLSSDSKSDRLIVNQLQTILQNEGVVVGSSDYFITGLSFSDNTILSILSSVSVLVVISLDFLENERCKWSLEHACHYKVIHRERYSGILIPVVCSMIGEHEIPDILQNLEPIQLENNPKETKDGWLPHINMIKRSISYARESYREDWFRAHQFLKRLPQNQFRNLITALTDDRLSVDIENCEIQYNILIDIMKGMPKDMQLRLAVNLLKAIDMNDFAERAENRDAIDNCEHFNLLSEIGIMSGEVFITEQQKIKKDQLSFLTGMLVGSLCTILFSFTVYKCVSFYQDWKRKRQ